MPGLKSSINVIFSVSVVLIQVGLALLARPVFTSLFNLLFSVVLRIGLSQIGYLMHPSPSPSFSSGILSLELFIFGIIFLTMVAAWSMTRWWLSR